MIRYVASFLWGATAMACWFLSFNSFGQFEVGLPNLFLFPAIVLTVIAIGVMIALCTEDDL